MVGGFKFVLETTTHNFMNWLASEIDLPFHGYGLGRQEKYYKVLYILDGRIIPPSSEWPHPCYVADGYVATFKTGGGPDVRQMKKLQFDELHIDLDTADEVKEIGPVLRIEAREISENRTEVLGWCEDYAHLRQRLEDLTRKIPDTFVLAGYERMSFSPGIGDRSFEPDDLDEAIMAAYEQLKEESEGWERITDDAVSAKLAMMDKVNPNSGEAYGRKWIGERRRKLQELGIDVGKKGK